jgi:hypothetical protein
MSFLATKKLAGLPGNFFPLAFMAMFVQGEVPAPLAFRDAGFHCPCAAVKRESHANTCGH